MPKTRRRVGLEGLDRFSSDTPNAPFYLEDIMYKKGNIPWSKGKHIQMNTGRTHFKKGLIPWNTGKHWSTKEKALMSERQKGIPRPKPVGFSDTMRKVNPPKGIKFKFDSKDKEKKYRLWRHGYVWVYKPEHPLSRKAPPDYGYVLEHRVIVMEMIGRQLKPTEVIHHIDGDKSNNKPENLLLCEIQKEHNEVHTQMEIFVEKLIREGKVYYDREAKEFRFR